MRISLQQLEAVFWVARLGSVSQAAQHLNVTQPTISLRLRDLGLALGKPVFGRQGGVMRPTPDGAVILEHAAAIIGEVEKIQGHVRRREAVGLVRLGISEAIALAGLPAMLSYLGAGHPRLRLELAVGTSDNLEQDLIDGTIDVAIGINLYADPRLTLMPFGVQEATWTAGADAGLPAVIRPRDVVHLPVLTNPAPSPGYRQTTDWFASGGLEPRQISVGNSVTVIARLVAAGVGIALLPARLVRPDVDAGRLTALRSDPAISHPVISAAHRINDRRPAIDAVVSATRRVLDDLEWADA